MSRRRKIRRSVRWARYFNHYSYMSDVIIGGDGAVAAIWVKGRHWKYVRRQAKHRFGER